MQYKALRNHHHGCSSFARAGGSKKLDRVVAEGKPARKPGMLPRESASVTDWEGTLETLVAVIGGTCCVYGILRASAATTQNYRNGKE